MKVLSILIVVCLGVSFAEQDTTKDTVCHSFCETNFPTSTGDNENTVIHACRQGCSLKRRILFTGDNSMPSVHMDKCVDACGVAFKDHAPLLKACKKGCAHDLPVVDTNVVKPTDQGVDVVMEEQKGLEGIAPFNNHRFFGIGPVILTPEQQASNERVAREDLARPAEANKTASLLGEDGGAKNPFRHDGELLGADHGVKNPFAHEFVPQQLLGADGGAKNPFASEFIFPAQPQLPRQQLLGADGGAKNPFAHEFQAPLGVDHGAFNPFADQFRPENQGPGFARVIITTNRDSPFEINTDQFFADFDKIMNEMTEEFNGNTLQQSNNDVNQLLNKLMGFGRRQSFDQQLRLPSVVSDPSPIMFNSEGQGLDLAAHEPSPPTRGRYYDNDGDYESYEEKAQGQWLRCLKRRAQKMAHLAHGMLVVALLLLVALTLCMCHRRVSARRLSNGTQHHVQYMQAENRFKPPPSYYAAPGSHVAVDVEGANMKVASLPLVHTPPPAYEEQQKAQEEKDPESVKVVA